jgi:mannosyl-oligosaccharide alpha-1,2-mannosidase
MLLATIIDGLDTAIIMGLSTEYQKAIGFVDQINWSQSLTESKTFETCIRYMGGLISAYELLPDPRILKKLDELVQQVVLPAFDTPNGIPAPYVNVST